MAFGGLLKNTHTNTGLMAPNDESEDQPAQSMEEVLKKRREKMAQTKLGIQPETDPDV